jgi:glycine betaine/proline transport system substrate-binding protein
MIAAAQPSLRASGAWTKGLGVPAALATIAMLMSACVSTVNPLPSGSAAGPSPCGTVTIAVNVSPGSRADAAVVGYLLEHNLGCTVVKRQLDDIASWQFLAVGKVDVILENWDHGDLAKTFISTQKMAQNAGPNGNVGFTGWFTPKYVVDANPDLLTTSTNPKVLNNFVGLFKTDASGGQGQLLDGDPHFVTQDHGMINGFRLDYRVVYSGSDQASQQAILAAVAQKQPILAYYVTPNWFSTKVDLVHLALPAFHPGCDRDPNSVPCDYPVWPLDKVVSTKFATSGSPAFKLIQRFTWTNADQDLVSASIFDAQLSDDAAATRWLDANPTKWQAWLP